jgi:hypothetical protein
MSIIDDDEFENQLDDDLYEPVEPQYYDFKALSQLSGVTNVIVPENITTVSVVGYRINNEKRFPFIEYLLFKTQNKLDYYKMQKPTNNITIESVLNIVDTNLMFLLLGVNSSLDNTFNFTSCYKGYKTRDNNLYVFYDLTSLNIQVCDIYRKNDLWFCLIDEILNTGAVCDITISENVKQFFIDTAYDEKYPYYHLYDEHNNVYETPKVVYVGTSKSKTEFTYTFGVSKKDASSPLGAYYYFTNFNNAITQGIQIENASKSTGEGGIVRFAVFLGKLQVKQNLPDEPADCSDIKTAKITLGTNEDANYERMTIRITDYDGNWASEYDSVILEDILLDEHIKIKDAPLYVCKEYDQQCPLSYHYINKDAVVKDDLSKHRKNYLIV